MHVSFHFRLPSFSLTDVYPSSPGIAPTGFIHLFAGFLEPLLCPRWSCGCGGHIELKTRGSCPRGVYSLTDKMVLNNSAQGDACCKGRTGPMLGVHSVTCFVEATCPAPEGNWHLAAAWLSVLCAVSSPVYCAPYRGTVASGLSLLFCLQQQLVPSLCLHVH